MVDLKNSKCLIESITDYFISNHNKKSRLESLKDVLEMFDLEYNLQVLQDEFADTTNVILRFGSKNKPALVLGAHYDVWGTSVGINDNTVAVATLLSLAIELKDVEKFNQPVEIVFFDKEETGMVGASLYAQSNPKVDFVYILDIIGYGNTKLLCGVDDKETILPQISPLIERGFRYMNTDLPSDNAVLKYRLPAKLIVVTPKVDLIIEDNRSRKVRLKPNPTFYSSFHNQKNDNNVKKINWSIAREIKGDMLEVIEGWNK